MKKKIRKVGGWEIIGVRDRAESRKKSRIENVNGIGKGRRKEMRMEVRREV